MRASLDEANLVLCELVALAESQYDPDSDVCAAIRKLRYDARLILYLMDTDKVDIDGSIYAPWT